MNIVVRGIPRQIPTPGRQESDAPCLPWEEKFIFVVNRTSYTPLRSRWRPWTRAIVFLAPASKEDEEQGGDAHAEDALTHGFHVYPARMHPGLARSCLQNLSVGPGSVVLDPFCGSGTVLVEAMREGWRSLGSDLSPLAVALTRVKTQRRDGWARERFLDRLKRVADASLERVAQRKAVKSPLDREHREYYEAHVRLEMSGLLLEIRDPRHQNSSVKGARKRTRQRDHDQDTLALEMVFSALVTKFSRKKIRYQLVND